MMKLAKLYMMTFHMLNAVWVFLIMKLHEQKSYRVSPRVASNFYEPTSQTTCRIQLVGSCITGLRRASHYTIYSLRRTAIAPTT